MLQGKTSSVFTLSLLLTLAASTGLPAALFNQLAQAQSPSASFSLPASVPRGTTVRVDGSESMAATNQALKQRFEAQYQGTTVNLATEGTAAALSGVLNGTIDLAAIGRPLTQAEQAQGLVEVPITREKIAIIVGPDNPFRGDITFEQFARIFRGEITDWSQLGGSPGRIRFVDRPESSDTRQAFRNYKVFQVAPFQTGSNAAPVSQDSTAAVIAALGQDGISYAIANQVIDQPNVRIVPMHNTLPTDPRYPFSQPRAFVYSGTPNAAVQSFLGFATAPIGQQTIAQARVNEGQAIASAPPAPAAGTTAAAGAAGTTGAVGAAGATGATGTSGTAVETPGTAVGGTAASPTASPPIAPGVSPSPDASPGAIAPGTVSPSPDATAVPGAAPGAAGTTDTASGTTGTTGTTATEPATSDRGGLGWLPWLLLPLALLGGLLFWRSRRRPADQTLPTARPADPIIPPTAGSGTVSPETGVTGTTLAQRTGSVVSADRLEIMSDAPGSVARSSDVPADAAVPIVPEAAGFSEVLPEIQPDVEPAAPPEIAMPEVTASEPIAVDPETVAEIPPAAIDPAVPSAVIDPTLLGGAAIAGAGALYGLSQLRDRDEAAAVDPTEESAAELAIPTEETVIPETVIPETVIPATVVQPAAEEAIDLDLAAADSPESSELAEPAEPIGSLPETALPLAGLAAAAGLGAAASLDVPEVSSDAADLTLVEPIAVEPDAEGESIQPGFVEVEPPAAPSEPMAAELVAFASPEVEPLAPEEIAAEEELAADLLEEREVTEGFSGAIAQPEASVFTEEAFTEEAFTEETIAPPLAQPQTAADSPAADTADLLGGIAALGAIAAGAGIVAAQNRETPETLSGTAESGAADERSDGLVASPLPVAEDTLDEQSAIEAARFDVGQSDLSSEELATVDANLPDLPGGYGESQIVLLPRDPQWAYAYWDVPAEQKQAARQQGGSRFALRFYDVTNIDFSRQNPHSLQQYECDEMARNWYIPVPLSDRDYVAEVGYVADDGRWILLARSLPIRIPPVYPSDWYDEQFLTVDWQADLRDRTFIELMPPGQRTTFNNPIYDRIFGLTESAEAQRVAGSLYGSMQQVPEQTISSFASGAGLVARTESGMGMSGVGMSGVGMSGVGISGAGMSGAGMSGAGMYSMSGIGFSGVPSLTQSGIGMMSGVGMLGAGAGLYSASGLGMMSGVGMSGVGMSGVGIPGLYTMSGAGYTMSGIGMMSGAGLSASMPPMRPRRFWLVADAELIIYGATEPDARVTIAGRPIQLNPDGTFRFQMSFQDGVIDFPILAVAEDGEQTRSIHLTFERETPSRNTNRREEAQDEWFPG